MSVTPTITADKKYVILMIQTMHNDLVKMVQQNAIALSQSGALVQDTYELPITENTTIMTRVHVPDQGTVMLGGLTLAAEEEVEAGVPVLSKIPLIGRLFSNRSEAKDKQILLILVKPTIILKEEAEADAIAAMQD
jgi:type II secretory pathway component GspD/PulD (secretin)